MVRFFSKHFRLYTRYVKYLGIKYGLKNIIMIVGAHVHRKEKPYSIRSGKTGTEPFYVRTNTSDIQLVNCLLLDGGEYDFLLENPYKTIVESSKLFIDAGANIGVFSRLLLNINGSMEGYCVEPEKTNIAILRKNIERMDGVKIVEGALWNKKCNLRIVERNGGSHVSFAVEECENEEAECINAYEAWNLDIGKVDIFKIDIEGSEYEVFDDSSENWIDYVKMYIIEFHDRIKPGCSDRVRDRLLKHGFGETIYGENHIFIKKHRNI